MLADGREVEHVVERGDGVAVRGREAERVGDLLERLRRQPAVPFLRETQRGDGRGTGLREPRRELAHLLRERVHLSTSPITVSSEPTIAIMSAIKASLMHVAVASSATNDGARNLTRHGRGPPSETT